MNPKLAAMLSASVVFTLGGVAIYVTTPQPATRTMLELKDAGILDGQRLVLVCPERLTKQTKRRIERNQPGLLRPAQSYAHIARSARCFNPDGGNCLRPSDGLLRIADLEGQLIIPSLRKDLSGIDLDAGVGADDGGDNDDVDDSNQYANTSCELLTCTQFNNDVDAGLRVSPYVGGCLGGLNRLALQPSPCMIPNGLGRAADGGWCEESCGGPVDCRFGGPYAEQDGGPRWRGFNTGDARWASGSACVPVECSVVAGDVPQDWL